MTYFQISVELLLYSVLRIFIKLIESLFQSSSHRRMRREIWNSPDYNTWLDLTRKLDKSQGRDWWQRTVSDEVSSRYNWAFIRELMKVSVEKNVYGRRTNLERPTNTTFFSPNSPLSSLRT
jgi:hypothetical protein